jgi:hypothetical protein
MTERIGHRLIKEALFSNELFEEHHLREVIRARAYGMKPEGCDTQDPSQRSRRLAERIKKDDPFGEKPSRLLEEVLNKE